MPFECLNPTLKFDFKGILHAAVDVELGDYGSLKL